MFWLYALMVVIFIAFVLAHGLQYLTVSPRIH